MGILVIASPTLRGNDLTGNGIGLLLQGREASAIFSSGRISNNTIAGVRLIGGASIDMALDSQDDLSIVQNEGVGLLVADDDSLATLNSDHILFADNVGGDRKGGEIDDVADADADGLGLAAEVAIGSNPDLADTDGDGLLDGFEAEHGFNPLTPGDGAADTDGDGLSNLDEQNAGSNPRLADTDGDGLSDFDEVTVHLTDPLRLDTDRDGLGDGDEVLTHGSDPTNPDTDNDGLGDGEEVLLAGSDPLNPDDATGVADLIVNGGFEAEDGSLNEWTQVIQTGIFVAPPTANPGAWSALTTTSSPIWQLGFPLPTAGVAAAIAESQYQSILSLSQEIDLPLAASVVLGVDVFVISGPPFATPEMFDLDFHAPLSHQFRIDLMQPDTAPFAIGDEVLAPLFRTEAGDPPIIAYQRMLFDLTPYAGQRVVLRFIHNQDNFGMVSGIDNVRVLATGGP